VLNLFSDVCNKDFVSVLKNQKLKAFCPQINANRRECFVLCACGALHPINAYAFICVFSRLFADNMLFCF